VSGRVGDAPPLTAAAVLPGEDERQAFAEIFDAHAAHVFDYCFGILGDRQRAAGASQATLIAAHSLLGRLQDKSRIRAWLLALARRECQDSPSQRAVRTSVSDRELGPELTEALAFVDSADDDVTDAPTSQFSMRGAGEIASVSALLAWLPASEREVLNLIYRHEISPAELPAILGLTAAAAGQLRTSAEASCAAALCKREADRETTRPAGRAVDLAEAVDQTGDIAAWADQTGDIAAWAVGSGERTAADDRDDSADAADRTGDLAAWADQTGDLAAREDRTGDLAAWADQTGDRAAREDRTGDLAAWADQTGDRAAREDRTGDLAAWADQTGDRAAWEDRTGDIAIWSFGTPGPDDGGPGDESPDDRHRVDLARLSVVPLASLPPSVWRRVARAALDPRFQAYRDAVRAHAEHLGADGFPVAADDPVLPSFRRLLGSSALLAGLLLAPAALGAAGYAVFGPAAMAKVAHEHTVVPFARAPGSYAQPGPSASPSARTKSAATRSTAHAGSTSPATIPSAGASASQPSPSTSSTASHSSSSSPPASLSPPPPSQTPTTSPSTTPTSSSPASTSSSPASSQSSSAAPAESPSAADSPSPGDSSAPADSQAPADSLSPSAS
jgi:DNA-directed RNA polymerase specialized sigma24 family protein